VDAAMSVFASPGSELARAVRARGLRVCHEVFADRTYQRDGSLTPRARSDALIRGEGEALAQVLRMLRDGFVRATDGSEVPLVADTVCVHGDGPDPVAIVRRLREGLIEAGIEVRAPDA
jgi:5-oxoprolinase (ATP-hydrolysing) subunit A